MKSYLKAIFALLVVFSLFSSSPVFSKADFSKSQAVFSGVLVTECTILIYNPAALFIKTAPQNSSIYSEGYRFISYQGAIGNSSDFECFLPYRRNSCKIGNPVSRRQLIKNFMQGELLINGWKIVDNKCVITYFPLFSSTLNALLPGSGANNEFKILKPGIASLNYFRIFNRWGNLFLETTYIDLT